MAEHQDGGPGVNLGSSQSHLFDTIHIGQKFVKISNAQSKLLDNPAAWTQSVNNRRQNAVFNVPADILKNVKQLGERVHHRPSPSPQQSQSRRTHTPTPSPANLQEQGESVDTSCESPEGTPISGWAPSSPIRPPPASENQAQHESSPVLPDKPEFVTQLPAESRSSVPQTVKRPTFNDFPSSSIDHDEMDVEIPVALDPINTTAQQPTAPPREKAERIAASGLPRQLLTRQMATPPSAQIIPSTLPPSHSAAVTSPVKRPLSTSHHPNQRPYKKIGLINSPVKVAQEAGGGGFTAASFQSSSTVELTPRIVPSTHRQNESPKEAISSTNPYHGQGSRSPSAVPSNGRGTQGSPPPLLAHERSPEFRPPSSELTPMFPSLETGTTSSIPAPESPSKEPAPFDLYKMKYPAYKGGIKDFITSCMYIQQHQRRIRTSLYDDFIRAWVEGYIPYVQSCDNADPPIKAQSVFDWYNQIDDDPEFTLRVVTRQNILSFLEYYPEEFNSAQSILEGPSKDSQRPVESPSAQVKMAEDKVSLLEAGADGRRRSKGTLQAQDAQPSPESGPTPSTFSVAPVQEALTMTRANSGSPHQTTSAHESLRKPKHSLSDDSSAGASKRRASDSYISIARGPLGHSSRANVPETPARAPSPSVTRLHSKTSGRPSPLSSKPKAAKGTASKSKSRPPRVNFAANPDLLESYYRKKYNSDMKSNNIAPTLGKDGKSLMGSSAPVSDTPIPGQRPH